MDLFATDTLNCAADTEQDPIVTLRQHIEQGDAKGAIRFLRSLRKDTLSRVLLYCGFGLCGNYREWVSYAGNRILLAAEKRQLPLDPGNTVCK